MVCSICNVKGHNVKTCKVAKENKTANDIKDNTISCDNPLLENSKDAVSNIKIDITPSKEQQ